MIMTHLLSCPFTLVVIEVGFCTQLLFNNHFTHLAIESVEFSYSNYAYFLNII